MKLYFAGPLFTTPERTWNVEVVTAMRAAGHEIFLPQEQEPGKDAAGIFATDVGGIDWADGLVAVMDGPDPDSGTCWEVGYAYGCRKPIVLVRTDSRNMAGEAGTYNPMMAESATVRLDLPAASTTEVIGAILDAHERVMRRAAAIAPETWREVGTIPWYGPQYSLDDLVVYQMYGHKREHDPQLGAVLEAR